jgi:cytochrome c oxidase subunit 2
MGGFVLLATGAVPTQDLSIFNPASPPAQSIRTLSFLVFAITGFIFVVVEGVLVYSLIRFRRRAGAGATEPPQVYGSNPIEVAWTVAPALIVLILVLVVTRTLWEVDRDLPAPQAGDNTLFVTVVGHQWWWEYQYRYYNGQKLQTNHNGQKLDFIPTANELHIPASEDGTPRPVYLTLESADVCHSFWVPRLAGKTDLIPGRTNRMWLQTSQQGLFVGQCAEYCGTQHANMLLRVVVSDAADFKKWLDNQQKPARDVDDPEARYGKTAFLGQTCVDCHRVRGTPARGSFGPDLTHLMSRDTLAAGVIANDPDGQSLRRWIGGPQKVPIDGKETKIYPGPQVVKPGCLMPDFGLSERDLNRIVGYLRTLK